MVKESARYMKVDGWIFEIKTVRALKVDDYGKPYSAIANCNINGDTMYVDGLLTKEDKDFTKEDGMAFQTFCQKLGIDSLTYHRYQNGQSVNKNVKINDGKLITKNELPQNTDNSIRLVK